MMSEYVQMLLKDLYGSAIRDVTRDGYQNAIARERRKSPAKARTIARDLKLVLDGYVFPRARKDWRETSQGTRARLALLHLNPHVDEDVMAIRDILGIPVGQVSVDEREILLFELPGDVPREAARRVVEGHLAGWWLKLHRQVARGNGSGEGMQDRLPDELQESAAASAMVAMGEVGTTWLRRTPVGPAPYDGSGAPIEWAVGRLVERHRLPWHAADRLCFYVLTLDRDLLKGIELLEVQVDCRGESSSDPESFTISIRGLDEFVTKEDWDHIWSRYVRREQDHLWEMRGGEPQGRKSVDIRSLERVLEAYHRMIRDKLTVGDVLNTTDLNWEDSWIRERLHELGEVLAPIPDDSPPRSLRKG